MTDISRSRAMKSSIGAIGLRVLCSLVAVGLTIGLRAVPEVRGSEVIERDLFPQSISLAEYSDADEAPGMHGTCARRRTFTQFYSQGVYDQEKEIPDYGLGYQQFISHDPDDPCHRYNLRRQVRVTFNLAPLRRYQGVEVENEELHFNLSGNSWSREPWGDASPSCISRVLVAEADDPVGGQFPWLTDASNVYGISSLSDRGNTVWWFPLDDSKAVVEHWVGGGWANHGLVLDPVMDENHTPNSEHEYSACYTFIRELRLKVRFTYRELAALDDPVTAILVPGARIGTDVPVSPVAPSSPPPKPPELIVLSLQVRGKDVSSGSNCDPGENTVLAVIRNTGDAVAGPFAVRLQVDGEDRALMPVSSLDGGGERVATFEKVRLQRGDRMLRLIADANAQVSESNEGNNFLEQKVSCRD